MQKLKECSSLLLKGKFMKKLLLLLLLMLPTFAFAVLDTKTAIWDQYNKLSCFGQYSLSCEEGFGCERKKTSAHWEIDFVTDQVSYLNSETGYNEKIVGKFYKGYGKSSSINTISINGRMMKFDNNKIKNPSFIHAVLSASNLWEGKPFIIMTKFNCHPQK